MSDYIKVVQSDQGLEEDIIRQIKPKEPYFADQDYLRFSKSADSRFWGQLARFSSIFAFDIYVDQRLLNNFTFVITEQKADSIIGYIKQNRPVEQPTKYYYYIPDREIRNIVVEGSYDIYGFHNDTLVLKNTYPFTQ